MTRLTLGMVSLALVSACEDGVLPVNKKSDYTGSFYTQEGQCPSAAEMSVSTSKDKVSVAFYCFISPCFSAKGHLAQSGYFDIKLGDREYINGHLSDSNANGKWSLTISGKKCSGRFEAKRTAD